MRPTAAQRVLLRTALNQSLSLAIATLLLLPASAAALHLAHTISAPRSSVQLVAAISAARAMSTCARSSSSSSSTFALKASFWRSGGSVGVSSSGGNGMGGSKRSRDNGWAAAFAPPRARRIGRRGRGLQGAGSLSCVCAVPPLSIAPMLWDAGMGVTCLAASVAWVKVCTGLAKRGTIKPQVSRKLVHATAAPLFMVLWPLFSSSPGARFVAAGVPLAQAGRLTAAGLSGDKKNEDASENELVQGISRSGRASETLGGPLKYALALVLLTAVGWRTSIVGIVAILQMAVGDGLADLVGRRFGKHKWTKGGDKSVEGSAAFALGAFASSMALIAWFRTCGVLAASPASVASRVVGISVACAAVELAPASVVGDDNVNVPVTAIILGRLLFAPGSPFS